MSAPAPARPRRGTIAVLALLVLVLAFPAGMGEVVRAVFGGFALLILAGVLLYALTGDDSSGGPR
jgi:hypothetical protein